MAGSTRNPWEENYSTEGDSASGAKPWDQSYQEPEKPKRTLGEAIKDTGAQLAEGVNTTLGAITSVVAPQSKAAGFFRDNTEHWRDKQSDVLKGRIAETDKRIQEAGKDGVMSQIGTAASEYWNDPAQAARLVATNLPSMAATLGTGAAAGFAAKGVAAARGLDAANKAALAAKYGTATAAATNAALNAGGARGEAFEDLQKTALAQGMTPEQAEQAGVSGSIMPGVVGGVAGAISGKIGLEKAILGQATTGAFMRKAAGAFGAELAGEQIEELAPKVATNYQVGRIDPGRTLTDDLGRTMVETAIGAGPGAVVAGGAAGMRTGELPPSPGAGEPTTSPGAADPNAPVPPGAAPVDAPEAPNLTTSPGAGVARDGMDFTREVDTTGLSLQDPAEQERARAATVDYQPGDTTPQWETSMGAAAARQGLDMPAPEFDADGLGLDPIRQMVKQAADAGGALSTAAGVALDLGATNAQFIGATGRDVQLRQTGPGVTDESNVIDVDAREVPDQRGIPTARRLTNDQDGGARATSSQPLALPAPTNLREGLERIRAQRQEAANAQATAPEATPASAPVPAAGTGAAEAAGVQPAGQRQLSADEQAAQDREEARAKELSLPPVLSARLQEAHKAHGRDVKRSVVERSIANEKANNTGTPKAKRERADRIARLEADLALFDEAAAMPPKEAAGPASIPATIGANSEPTPHQAIQAGTQPAQAGPAQPAQGLTDAAPAQNPGAQSTAAPGAQGAAIQGAAWDALDQQQRTSVLLSAGWRTNKGGLNVIGKRLLNTPWEKISDGTRGIIAKNSGQNQAQALDGKAQVATETVAPEALELTALSPAQAAAQQDAQEQAAKAEAAAKRAADAAAKAEDERKRIAQASVRAADSFELGQDPMDSLTGQGSMFDDAPAQQAPTTAVVDDDGRERFTLSIEMFGDVPYRASKPVDAGNGDVVSSRVITTKTKLTAANAQSLGLPKDKGTVYAWRVSVIRRADGAAHSVIEAMATDNGRSPDGEVLAHFKEVENPEAMERIAPAIANAALSDWRAAQPQQAPTTTEAVAQPITRADVTAAQQQAAAIITERIDAMTAGEVNTIAKQFLPTMGKKATASKERNKAAMTDAAINLEAAAAEVGATLPAEVKRALQADVEGRVADAGQDDGDKPAIPEGYKPAGEPFYRGGKQIQGYAPFTIGERVTMKDSAGQSGVIESLASPDDSGVFASAVVKFDNGLEQMVQFGKLEAAAPQPDTPKLTPAEAKALMAWEDLGQKDGVKTHALTFYESQADKDAKRGRMIVAKVSKGDRSATAWMVDGEDKTFGMLAHAKKLAEEVGMAGAVADGFVEQGGLMFSRGTTAGMPENKAPGPQGDAQQGASTGNAVTSKWFTEDNRLSNLSQTGASWQRIRENNPVLRGKSVDDTITVYRATIGDSIRPDDYVAVDKSTLRTELKNVRERDGEAAKIVSMQVQVRDLLMGNDATEFVFFPEQKTEALSTDENTGLPLNADGTVTIYHHTSAAAATAIRRTGTLKSQAEPDVYVTTYRETDTGYGDTAVAIRIDPARLQIDDEFPNGRKDFRLNVGRPGGSIRVELENEQSAPASQGGLAFSFAGARAATADKHALVTAQDRLSAGEDAETVRQETGWFQGKDGKWRYEISDKEAFTKGTGAFGEVIMRWHHAGVERTGDQLYKTTVGDVLYHPALFAAYPALAQMEVQMMPKGVRARGRVQRVEINGAEYESVIQIREDLPSSEWLSVMLHELQHGIQSIEGFANGGPSGEMMWLGDMRPIAMAEYKKLIAEINRPMSLEEYARQAWGVDSVTDEIRQDYAQNFVPSHMAALERKGLDGDLQRTAGWRAYRRLAGEVEARNTQARQGMTDAQRRATPPNQTADVADSDVIVVFNGKEMESAPEPANAEQSLADAKQQLGAPLDKIRADSNERNVATQMLVDGLKEKWTRAPEIIVARNMQDPQVPQAVRDYDAELKSQGSDGEARGFIYKGKVYLLSDQLNGPEQIAEVLFHEVLGHYGLRGAFGESLTPILQQIGTMRRRDVVAKAREYGLFDKDALGGLDKDAASDAQIWAAMSAKERLSAAEEVLAEMAQTQPNIGFVQRAIAAIRNWLRANVPGFKSLDLTDNDIIQAYILPARRYVTRSKETGAQSLERAMMAFSRTATDQTQTEAFKRWFAGSKVVDADGKPMVVYHGTHSSFTEFKPNDALGGGMFFSPSPEEAGAFTGATGSNIMPVYLSAQKVWPKIVRSYDEVKAIRAAKSKGYDAIRVRDDQNGVVNWVVFDPTQVKSAIGNSGAFDPANADIRFSRAPSVTATPASGWDAPVQTGFDDVIYKLQDKNIDLKRVVEAITKSAGQVADSINAYLKEELFHKRAAKRVADFGARELKPLMNQMRLAGLSMEDVEEYLHARHAKEANAVIAQRNPGVPGLQDGGSGMTNAAADNYFAKLNPTQRRKLEGVAAKVDAIIADTRKLYVEYGLEDQATVDGWAGMFQHYIPLMREDKEGGMGIGQGFSVKGKETKSRTGSTRKVVDILANVAMQREKLIVRGEKNIVAQALVGLAQANPNPDFWEVRSRAPTERVFDPKTGVVVDRPDPLFKSRENVAVAKVKDANGKVTEQMVVFNEDNPRAVRMAAAMKNLDAGNLEGLLGMSAKITRYFSAINTQYNPVFGVVNLVRDVQGAMVNLAATPLAGQQGKIARDTASALRGIYSDIRKTRKGGQATSQWSQLWEQMQDDGGTTGYRDLFKTSADRANDLKSILNPEGWMDSKWGKFFTADGRLKVPLSMAQKGATEIFGWLSDYNEAMENGVRLAAYKAALDKGMSREQAASLAKNLTVNFNRKGQVGMQAGAVYAFFNAAMQGTARIGQTLFDMDGGDISTLRLSKTGKAVVYGGVMLGVMQALALSAAGFDDDDPPEFVRERSLIIPTGDKTYVSIPMPLGLHVIPGIGRHATEFALSGFDKPAKRAVSMVGMFADAFNPIGNAGLSMQTIAPTALDPLAALSENKDWTGKPIARVSSNKAMPGHTQWKDTATGFSKVVAEAINWISGGNEYVAGAFSPTPDQIDYLLAQVGGGVAREAAKVQQTISTALSGETLPTHKIPLVGRFVGNAASQASQGSAFYANLNKLNELETEIKGLRKDGRFDEAAKLVRENPQATMIAMANRAERDVQKLRRDKRELIAKDASREEVRAKEEQITAVMMRLNEAAERRKANQ